jgi:hypothetical protein
MTMTNQISMLDQIDLMERAKKQHEDAQIQAKLEAGYSRLKNWGTDTEAGTVVIYPLDKFETSGYQRHFYRCVVGYHRTVSGLMMHLISVPDEEWPDVPTWQPEKDGKRWTYPMREMWVKNEPEKLDIDTDI